MRVRPAFILIFLTTIAAAGGFLAGRGLAPHATESRGVISKIMGPAEGASPRGTGPQRATGRNSAQRSTSPGDRYNEVLGRLWDIGEGENSEKEFEEVALREFIRDPAVMIQFAARLQNHNEIVRKLTMRWAQTDAAAVTTWLQQHEKAEGRDTMITGLVKAVAKMDPDGAAAWMTSIKDPAQSLFAAKDAGYGFYCVSDGTAADLLNKMGLLGSPLESSIREDWKARYERESRRCAQNIESCYNAALKAACYSKANDVATVIQELNEGLQSNMALSSGGLFKINSGDWTSRELAGVMQLLEFDEEGTLQYTGPRE